jgi:hypothetical protein
MATEILIYAVEVMVQQERASMAAGELRPSLLSQESI